MTPTPISPQSHRSVTLVFAQRSAAERVVHQPLGDRIERGRGEHGRYDETAVERGLDIPGPGPDRERPDDRGDNRDRTEHQRVDRHLASEVGELDHAEQHHRDCRDRVCLEQVGRHAGAVADVVADVVRDHGRVTRIVLRDPGLDLADEVGADIRSLGEDASAEAGKDRDQRASEAEADESVDGILVAHVREDDQRSVVAGDPEEGQANHEEAGDGAPLEGDVQGGRDPSSGGLRDASVRSYGQVHPDESRSAREKPADHEPDRGLDVLQRDQQDRHDYADAGDDRVLPPQIRGGALLDRA